MNKVLIQPARGLLVPNPQNNFKPLPPEGAEVELDRYWKRRLADGDVSQVKPPSKAAPKKQNA